jgi:hypothetical protein
MATIRVLTLYQGHPSPAQLPMPYNGFQGQQYVSGMQISEQGAHDVYPARDVDELLAERDQKITALEQRLTAMETLLAKDR